MSGQCYDRAVDVRFPGDLAASPEDLTWADERRAQEEPLTPGERSGARYSPLVTPGAGSRPAFKGINDFYAFYAGKVVGCDASGSYGECVGLMRVWMSNYEDPWSPVGSRCVEPAHYVDGHGFSHFKSIGEAQQGWQPMTSAEGHYEYSDFVKASNQGYDEGGAFGAAGAQGNFISNHTRARWVRHRRSDPMLKGAGFDAASWRAYHVPHAGDIPVWKANGVPGFVGSKGHIAVARNPDLANEKQAAGETFRVVEQNYGGGGTTTGVTTGVHTFVGTYGWLELRGGHHR